MAQAGNRTFRVVTSIVGVLIFGGGAAKLLGQSSQVAAFATLGLPIWFRALVGTFEMLGGMLMLVPITTPAGSLIVSTILVGAVWAHAAHRDWADAIPAVVLLSLCLVIFRATRDRAIQLLGAAGGARLHP